MYDTLLYFIFPLTSALSHGPTKMYCIAVNGRFLLYTAVAC